jgi:hypothetical protein
MPLFFLFEHFYFLTSEPIAKTAKVPRRAAYLTQQNHAAY